MLHLINPPVFAVDVTVASGIASAAIAVLCALSLGDVARAASRRADGPGSRLVYIYAAIVTVAFVGLCLLVPAAAIPMGLGLLWLVALRRRRRGRKHEGLRILR